MCGNYKTIQALKGQSLSEYGLVAGIVLAIAVPALLLFGTRLDSLMQEWNEHLSFGKENTPAALSDGNPDQATRSENLQPTLPRIAGMTQAFTITTANGNTIRIDRYPTTFTESIVTVGANGTTDHLANTLRILALELKSNGEIDKAGFDDLMTLANQGHRIAQIEKIMEDAAKSTKTSEEYATKIVTWDGKPVTLDGLRDTIGYDTRSTTPMDVGDVLGSTKAKGETNTFIQLYKAYLQNNPARDPAIQSVIQTLSQQIAYLSEVSDCAEVGVIQGDIGPHEMQGKMISDVTHLNSTHICTTGQNKDSGIQCSSP